MAVQIMHHLHTGTKGANIFLIDSNDDTFIESVEKLLASDEIGIEFIRYHSYKKGEFPELLKGYFPEDTGYVKTY